MMSQNSKFETGDLIDYLLKKYGLEKKQKDFIERNLKKGRPEAIENIFKNAPGRKIANIVIETHKSNLKEKNIIPLIERDLDFGSKTAKRMAEDIIKGVEEKKLEKDVGKIYERWKEKLQEEKIEEKPKDIKKEPSPPAPVKESKDVYREPVEPPEKPEPRLNGNIVNLKGK